MSRIKEANSITVPIRHFISNIMYVCTVFCMLMVTSEAKWTLWNKNKITSLFLTDER